MKKVRNLLLLLIYWQAHLYVTKRRHVSARCLLSPEEERLVLDKAAKIANQAAAEAFIEAERESSAPVSLGMQAGR